MPDYITREEFGVNLFNVIKTISGIHTLRQQMNVAVHKEQPEKAKMLEQRWLTQRAVLAKQLPLLTNDEMAQILDRYPDVVTL